jgi:hypothetical protein
MATQLQRKPEFDHTLFVLPPIDDGKAIRWFAYLDEPDRWRRVLPSVDELLVTATDVLLKLFQYERGNNTRNPNFTTNVQPVPEIPPRWRVQVSVDCSEDQAEWTLELLDESAWRVSDYDLRVLRDKLLHRIIAADVEPVQAPAPHLPVPIRPEQSAPLELPEGVVGFAEGIAGYLAAIERKIEEERQVLVAAQLRIDALNRERQALRAAQTAYTRAASKGQKSNRGGHSDMGHAEFCSECGRVAS